MDKVKDFYRAGSHETPAGAFMAVKLNKDCPADGLVVEQGVAVAGKPGKAANMLGWPSVLRAVSWAAERSPAFRADLRRVIDEAEAKAAAVSP